MRKQTLTYVGSRDGNCNGSVRNNPGRDFGCEFKRDSLLLPWRRNLTQLGIQIGRFLILKDIYKVYRFQKKEWKIFFLFF